MIRLKQLSGKPIAMVIVFLAITVTAEARVIRVDAKAGANGDGESWATAYRYLQDALAAAEFEDELWLAAGVYFPDEGEGQIDNERSSTFLFRSLSFNFKILGGFAGFETSADQRNAASNVTVLSGDIDGNDRDDDGNGIAETTADIVGDNAIHVVTLEFSHPIFDGLVVNGGQANGITIAETQGGGVFIGQAPSGSFTAINCQFLGNFAATDGGAVHSFQSRSVMVDCLFSGNHAADDGGAVFIYLSSPELSSCEFVNNRADDNGGAIYSSTASTKISRCRIAGNFAGNNGGGVYSRAAAPELRSCAITGNSARLGGGIFFEAGGGNVLNCTLGGNAASSAGGGIAAIGRVRFQLANSLIWGNTAGGSSGDETSSVLTESEAVFDYKRCLVEHLKLESDAGLDGTIPTNDPLFADGISASSAPTTLGDYRLLGGSPAADAGIAEAHFGALTVFELDVGEDLDGLLRAADANRDGIVAVDIGAFERPPSAVHFVSASAAAGGDGASWATAFRHLQDALEAASADEEIWVAAGIYYPDEGASAVADDPASRFELRSGVSLLGGFSGSESLIGERDSGAPPSILSGDIDGDDADADGNGVAESAADLRGSNACHVLFAEDANRSARIERFTITAGDAQGGAAIDTQGGGMHLENSSPFMRSCVFVGNRAAGDGAGVFGVASSAWLSDCVIQNNGAGDDGGGFYFEQESAPLLEDCVVRGNVALGRGGGGYLSSSSASFDRCEILDNECGIEGGGTYAGETCEPKLRSCRISGNAADRGGAIYLRGASVDTGGNPRADLIGCLLSGNLGRDWGGCLGARGSASFSLTNCTLAGNASPASNSIIAGLVLSEGGEIGFPELALVNTVVWANGGIVQEPFSDSRSAYSITLDHSVIEVPPTGGSALVGDPTFVRPLAPGHAPTSGGSYDIRGESISLIDRGMSHALLEADLAGRQRILDGDQFAGVQIDIGAYEFDPPQLFAEAYPDLDPDGDENGNGRSNYLDYATGQDATSNRGLLVVPKLQMLGDVLYLETVVRRAVADVHPSLEFSIGQLSSWAQATEGLNYERVAVQILSPVSEKITYRLLLDSAVGESIFFRQRFSQNP